MASPTVIDALVVTLGLDPSSFTAEQRAAAEALEKLDSVAKKVGQRDQQRRTEAEREGREKRKREEREGLELARRQEREKKAQRKEEADALKAEREAIKKRADAYAEARRAAIGFGAAIAEIGLSKLVLDTATGVAATGRLAHNLDMSTQALAAWKQAVAATVGGSQDDAAATVAGITRDIQGLSIGDVGARERLIGLTQTLSRFSGQAINLRGPNGQPVTATDLLTRISGVAQHMDPARFSAIASRYGIDDGTINFLEQGPAAIARALAEQRGKVPDDKQAKADQALVNATTALEQSLTGLKNRIVYDIAPEMAQFAQDIGSVLDLVTGTISFSQFRGQVKEHRHQRHVERLILQGRTRQQAEAEATAAEKAGVDPSSRLPGLDSLSMGKVQPHGAPWAGRPFGYLWDRVRGWVNDTDPDYRPKPLAGDIASQVAAAAKAYGVDPRVMRALFTAEGGGYSNRSAAGAFGPAQLMPGTARMLGVSDDPASPGYDWHKNADAGVRYFRMLLEQFRSYEVAEAAYNAGPNNAGVRHFAETGDASQLPDETKAYLKHIRGSMDPGLYVDPGRRRLPGEGEGPPNYVPPNTEVTTQIGSVIINAPNARDAHGIARDARAALTIHPLVVQANTGAT